MAAVHSAGYVRLERDSRITRETRRILATDIRDLVTWGAAGAPPGPPGADESRSCHTSSSECTDGEPLSAHDPGPDGSSA